MYMRPVIQADNKLHQNFRALHPTRRQSCDKGPRRLNDGIVKSSLRSLSSSSSLSSSLSLSLSLSLPPRFWILLAILFAALASDVDSPTSPVISAANPSALDNASDELSWRLIISCQALISKLARDGDSIGSSLGKRSLNVCALARNGTKGMRAMSCRRPPRRMTR